MSADRDPLIGRLVAGKYLVTRRLARGGMGRIYKAEQQPLGRAVALKVLDASYADDGVDPEFEQRFLLEAATMARLQHPNTVTVFDYGATEVAGESTLFMVQEFVDGVTLKRLLQDAGPLEPRQALMFGREIARSLREAHRHGVVHRDLKPTNVMVVETDEGDAVKVLDFGIVKLMSDDKSPQADITVGGRFLGTPRYMAPEQADRSRIDPRTDLYALGIVLYELITGEVPFKGEPMQVLMAHLNEPVPPLADRARHPVTPEIEAVVMRCLAKAPHDRFGDAEALIEAIDAALGNITGSGLALGPTTGVGPAGMSIPPPPPPPPTPPPAKRSNAGLIAGVIMALLVIGVGIVIIGGPGAESPPPEPPSAQGAATAGADRTAAGQGAEKSAAGNEKSAAEKGTAEKAPDAAPDAALDAEAPPAEPDAAPDAAPTPTVKLTTEPSNARVRSGGEVLGHTPLDIPLTGELPLTVELFHAGYDRRWIKLDADDAGPMSVTLRKASARPKVEPKPKAGPKPALDIRTSR